MVYTPSELVIVLYFVRFLFQDARDLHQSTFSSASTGGGEGGGGVGGGGGGTGFLRVIMTEKVTESNLEILNC